MNPRPKRVMRAVGIGAIAVLMAFALRSAALSGPEQEQASPVTASDDLPAKVGRVIIRRPKSRPAITIGTDPKTGEPVTANCSTCHSNRVSDRTTNSADQLDEFHQGMAMAHGGSTCVTCHDAAADSLRLADGRLLPYEDSMQLCGQCHGPQLRDWRHGAHGGMAGYWDLTKGDRIRNHCTVCHDPHAPAIEQVMPAPPPNDRFLNSSAGNQDHD